MIWLTFALLTCAALLSVLLPLALHGGGKGGRNSTRELDEGSPGEIDAALEVGTICPNQAVAFPVDIRRPLSRGGDKERQQRISSGLPRTIAALFASAFIPTLSLAVYLQIGNHAAVDRPLVARLASLPGHADANKRIAEIEAYLRKHPNDGNAYEAIAPFYLREHRGREGVHALEEALRLLGRSAGRLAALGEAKVIADNGVVGSEARNDFEATLAIDSGDVTSRYYLGLAAAQVGDNRKASAIWSRLLIEAPAEAKWIGQVKEHLDELREPAQQSINEVADRPLRTRR